MADGSAAHDPYQLTLAKDVKIEADRLDAAIHQESDVIGRLLSEPKHMNRCGSLAPEHFAIEQFGRAFRAMLTLTRDLGTFTPRSVHEKSGVPYPLLMRAAGHYVPLMNFDDYVREIRQSSVIRAMMAATQKAAANGIGAPPGVIANMMRKAAADLMHGEDGPATRDALGMSNLLLDHVARIKSGQAVIGAPTGFQGLDNLIGGYRPGELVVVAARPGMGKTVFAVSSARQVAARDKTGVAFFSLEIGEEQTSARFASDEARDAGVFIPYSAMLSGRVSDKQFDTLVSIADRTASLNLLVETEPMIPIAEVDARIEKAQAKFGDAGAKLAVVFIDYLKFLKAADRYKGNRVLEIGEITGGLKEIAKKRGVCIVLLTQLNRGVEGREDKRPTLMDLRDSGEIEQDADIVLMLYREAYYLRNPKNPDEDFRAEQVRHELDVLVEKNRAGECGTVKLWCDVATSSVRDMEAR